MAKTSLKLALLSFMCLILFSCNTGSDKQENKIQETTGTVTPDPSGNETSQPQGSNSNVYSNQRFREVTVIKISENTFQVNGQGQIFEGSFSWVVEDGHNELKSGHEMTDAGAPEWGNFSFPVTVQKQRENSSLTLILFEISAKDGSRQHELTIPLL